MRRYYFALPAILLLALACSSSVYQTRRVFWGLEGGFQIGVPGPQIDRDWATGLIAFPDPETGKGSLYNPQGYYGPFNYNTYRLPGFLYHHIFEADIFIDRKFFGIVNVRSGIKATVKDTDQHSLVAIIYEIDNKGRRINGVADCFYSSFRAPKKTQRPLYSGFEPYWWYVEIRPSPYPNLRQCQETAARLYRKR